MDLQLNLSNSIVGNKKSKNAKGKNKIQNDAINKSNFNFVSKPKIEGKIIARQRKPNKIEGKETSFSFLKNNDSSTKAPSNSSPMKVTPIENKEIKIMDSDMSINISNTKIEKPSKSVIKKEPQQNFSPGPKFKQKSFNEKHKQDKFATPDGDKKPTFKQISALFRNNPEIPKIGQRHVKPIDEKVFSGKNFTDINIHSYSIANLEKNLGLKELTVVQQKAIPIILKGRDVLVRSQTGSGKTLAYALPIIEALQALRPKLNRQDGVKALVIVPTRELALQTYELFLKLVRPFTWIVPGYLIGGENRKAEKARIRKGFNILIGTPGRISDHLKNTASLKLNSTRCLILDEADRLLDMGYEKDVSGIVQALESHKAASKYDPMALMKQTIKGHIHFENDDQNTTEQSDKSKDSKTEPDDPNVKYQHELSNKFSSDKRQTVLLSATLTKAVETLAGLTMEDPVFVDSSDCRGTLIADSIAKPVQTVDEDNDEAERSDDDLEIVPQKSDDDSSEDDEDDDESNNDDEDDDNDNDSTDNDDTSDDDSSDENDEDAIKRNATIYKGIKAFNGIKTVDIDKPKKSKKDKKSPKTVEEKNTIQVTKDNDDSGSDSDYDFFAVAKTQPKKAQIPKDTTIFTDSGTHENPFQNAVQNAIAQDEMIIPSSVTQIYIVVPMKLRLVTLSALIVERCVNSGNGKMLVFMATQDLIDYHCEIISRVLTGKSPKKFTPVEKTEGKIKKNKKTEIKQENDELDDDVEKKDGANKLKQLIEKENASDDDYEYNYDGIPLEEYEAKMRAEKAFVDVEFFQLHGSMDQKTRTEVFKTFRNAKSGVLLCTDVAARGLDLPHVDCIVQFTGPISATDYVHRVGRTARAGNVGTAIMFLLPSEILFVRQLEERRIRLHQEEMENTLGVLSRTGPKVSFNKHRIGKQAAEQEAATALQQTYENLVEADKGLHLKACKAFTSWMRFYSTYPREARAAFDRRALHAGHAARALALREAPRQIGKHAPKDKPEKPYNRLSNQTPEERKEKALKKKSERVPAGFDFRPTSVKAAKRDRMMMISEFDSGLEPVKKKKKSTT